MPEQNEELSAFIETSARFDQMLKLLREIK